jgi:hypothetical protein
MPPQNVLSLKYGSLAFCLGRWCLSLVIIPYTNGFVRQYSSSVTGKFINENVYWNAKVKSVIL